MIIIFADYKNARYAWDVKVIAVSERQALRKLTRYVALWKSALDMNAAAWGPLREL